MSQHVFQDLQIERLVGHGALEARILLLQGLHAIGGAHLGVAEASLSGVERLAGHTVAAHQLGRRGTGGMLLQERDDLLGRKAGLLHQGLLGRLADDR